MVEIHHLKEEKSLKEIQKNLVRFSSFRVSRKHNNKQTNKTKTTTTKKQNKTKKQKKKRKREKERIGRALSERCQQSVFHDQVELGW